MGFLGGMIGFAIDARTHTALRPHAFKDIIFRSRRAHYQVMRPRHPFGMPKFPNFS